MYLGIFERVNTMKIAVMSDTHLREGKSLPRWVWEQVEGVDLILHAGDVIDIGLLTDLKQVAPLEAVKGNCDGWELARLPQRSIVSCGEIKIGLTHGAEGPGRTTTERAMRNFEHDQVDLIIFGHSHEPYLKNMVKSFCLIRVLPRINGGRLAIRWE